MKWISEITINNFRAFGTQTTIKIADKHHLLIYGENGSGKSSIYNGLKDFFSSSSNNIKFKLNKFEEAKDNKAGYIEITTKEDGQEPKKYKFSVTDSESNHKLQEIVLANKFKGFLDYKRMLKVHALEIPEDKTPDVFELIIKELLADHKVPDPSGGVTSVELLSEYKRIVQIITSTKSERSKTSKEELKERLGIIEELLGLSDDESDSMDDDQTETPVIQSKKEEEAALIDERESILNAIKIVEAKEELERLDASVKELLRKVITIANKFLKDHFKNKLVLDLNYSSLSYNERLNSINESLSLKIFYAGNEIQYYQAFLNEARLSSLAICLYLASIKSFEPGEDVIKILYLDDVFIGLDTSNRYPLLDIVKKEFIDDGFQVFVSTYDREWFELARHWFQTKVGKIKSLELFIEDDGDPNKPDYPIVLPYEGNLEKARALFKAKDYPAAGNYIRKACEEILKTLLPDTYKLTNEGTLIDDFEGLLNQLEKLYVDSNITKPSELLDSIKIYRKALLNPSSHNDSKSQLFKKEIEEAFEIVSKLSQIQKIERIQIAEKGRMFVYENVANNYRVELELTENVWKIIQTSGNTFSKHKMRITKWSWNGVDFATNANGTVMAENDRMAFCEQERPLNKIFEIINHSTNIPIPPNPYSELRIGTTGTFNDLLS